MLKRFWIAFASMSALSLVAPAAPGAVPDVPSSPGPNAAPNVSDNAAVSGAATLDTLESLLPAYESWAGREMLPIVIKALEGADPKFVPVIEYGKWLQAHPGADADGLTIHADAYWLAYVTVSMKSTPVLFSRLLLLIREGSLARADYVKMFTYAHSDAGRQSDADLLDAMRKKSKQIREASDQFVETGERLFDQGEAEKAAVLVQEAQGIYPKNPRAAAVAGDFAHARAFDPFYEKAYAYEKAGKKESAARTLIARNIDPALDAIASGEIPARRLRAFADACAKLGELEFAAYAYHLLLTMTVSPEKGFDKEALAKFADCLTRLGANKAAAAISDQYAEWSKEIVSKAPKK